MSSYPTPQPAYPTNHYETPASNGLGVAGFVVSLAGLIVCGGFICPIGLLLSLIALSKAPRGFAIAGAIIGVLGSAIAVVFVMIAAGAIGQGWGMFGNFGMQGQTSNEMFNASFDIDDYYDNNNNSTMPDNATGTALVANYNDAWGTPMAYRTVPGSATDYEMLSAGPDLQMGTADDYIEYFTVYSASNWGSSVTAEDIDGSDVPAQQIDFAFEQAAQIFTHSFPQGTALPDTTRGSAALAPVRDSWGNAFKYSPNNPPYYHLKSAGPDGVWLTDDDITRSYYFEPTGGQ